MSEHIMVPDAITPVVGWRAYSMKDGRLRSVMQNVTWEPGVAHHAECYRETGRSGLFYTMMFTIGPTPPPLPESSRHEVGPKTNYDQLTGEHFLTSGVVKLVSTRRTVPQNVPAPLDECSCGIYAAQHIEKALEYVQDGGIIGRIALWGKVIVYTDGWRGEYGYPQALYVKTADHYKVAKQYGVPVLQWSDLPQNDLAAALSTPAAIRSGGDGFFGWRP